jgi:flavin-dependent dehydrogenase
MSRAVVIKGGGVAACCCASLLEKAGHKVFADVAVRQGSPVLMLSEQTQLLLRDVFGGDHLFEGSVKIGKRAVLWGDGGEAIILPHSGIVIAESTLLERLWPTVSLAGGSCDSTPWQVIASQRSLPEATQYAFGSRIAFTYSVELDEDSMAECCWVEAVRAGWLFLIPCGVGRGSLISVGSGAEELLSQSRLVSGQIKRLGSSTGSFPAYPRIISPLGGHDWIACGTAAIAFDPIAGEGAGNALREGILASAVIRAAEGGKPEDLLAHYSNRMMSGFLRHVQECGRFYTAVSGPWWQAEAEAMKQGVDWAQNALTLRRRSFFRLVGFELQACS